LDENLLSGLDCSVAALHDTRLFYGFVILCQICWRPSTCVLSDVFFLLATYSLFSWLYVRVNNVNTTEVLNRTITVVVCGSVRQMKPTFTQFSYKATGW